MDILGIGSVMTVSDMNLIANNPQLFVRLIELDKEDKIWYACQGYPGGTIIGNKKDTVRLDGVHIKLGSRFMLREHPTEKSERLFRVVNEGRQFEQDLIKGQELIDKHLPVRFVSTPKGRIPDQPNLPRYRPTPVALQDKETIQKAYEGSSTSKRKTKKSKKGKRK